MKSCLAVAAALLLIPSSLLAEEPAEKKFEGYSKFTKAREHFEINADATYVDSVEYTIKVLDKQAIGGVNSQSVSYSGSLTDMKVIAAYTLKKNGTHIDVPKNNFQVETNSGENGAAPIISDIKTKTVVFPDVDVGDSIVYSYQLIQKEALFPHQFSYSTVFEKTYIFEDSELSVTAPESLPIRVEARDIKGGETEKKGGKRHWAWHYENHEIAKPEQMAVSTFDFGPRVLITTLKDYAELAAAYESRAKPKAAVTERIRKLAADIAKDTKGDREIAKTLYEWVSKNIHYAGNCIGIGSVVPHDLDHILDNKIGDCKDHTALLQALLAAKGIESTPSLINSGESYALPDMPIVDVFDHVINYVPSLNIYLDSTSEVMPFGMLPPSEDGKPTIHTSSFDGIQHTPPSDNAKNHGTIRTDITFKADGSADGVIKGTVSGLYAVAARQFFEKLDMTQYKDMVVKAGLSSNGYKGTGEYLSHDDTKIAADNFSYEMKFHAESVLNLPGPGAIYVTSIFTHNFASIMDFLPQDNIDRPLHDFPCAGGGVTSEVVYHIPKEVEIIALPKDVHLKNKYAAYDATYKQDGTTVATSRTMADNTPGNVCKPDIYDEFKDLNVGMKKDLKSQIIYR